MSVALNSIPLRKRGLQPAIPAGFFMKAMPMTSTIKTKSADVGAAFDEFARAFEAFKEANDERLDEIETRCRADVVTERQARPHRPRARRAKRRLDQLALERPPAGARRGDGSRAIRRRAEHKAAFDAYVRTGEAAA